MLLSQKSFSSTSDYFDYLCRESEKEFDKLAEEAEKLKQLSFWVLADSMSRKRDEE